MKIIFKIIWKLIWNSYEYEAYMELILNCIWNSYETQMKLMWNSYETHEYETHMNMKLIWNSYETCMKLIYKCVQNKMLLSRFMLWNDLHYYDCIMLHITAIPMYTFLAFRNWWDLSKEVLYDLVTWKTSKLPVFKAECLPGTHVLTQFT